MTGGYDERCAADLAVLARAASADGARDLAAFVRDPGRATAAAQDRPAAAADPARMNAILRGRRDNAPFRRMIAALREARNPRRHRVHGGTAVAMPPSVEAVTVRPSRGQEPGGAGIRRFSRSAGAGAARNGARYRR